MIEREMSERLSGFEARLDRLETLLGQLNDKLERAGVDVPDETIGEGPVLPGTRIRCTDEVLHRLGRIPIPFVRQMVTQKVAETAQAENVPMVDVPFFERAATF